MPPTLDDLQQTSVAEAAATLAALHGIGATVAVAESCTGGLIGHLLTQTPGASEAFLGSAVVYANEAKQAVLGVDAELLRLHGAVSEPVAMAMAAGARRVQGRGRPGSDGSPARVGHTRHMLTQK